MSMYGEYIKERENIEILENDKGFATYYFINNGCYIRDIYIKSDYRKDGEASKLADEISKIAKEKGCNKLIGSICPSTNGSTDSLKVLLAYGFKLDSATNNFIALIKEI